jgi:site-specific DNA recombinase
VLAGLRDRLLDPMVIGEAMRAFGEEVNRLNRERIASGNTAPKQLAQVQSKIKEIVRSIEDGGYSHALGERLHELEAREAELKERMLPVPRLEIRPPTEKFLRRIECLPAALRNPGERDEATDLIRGLIDHIVITGDGNLRGKYTLTFHGELITIIEQMRCLGEPVCDYGGPIGAFADVNTPRNTCEALPTSRWLIVQEKPA